MVEGAVFCGVDVIKRNKRILVMFAKSAGISPLIKTSEIKRGKITVEVVPGTKYPQEE